VESRLYKEAIHGVCITLSVANGTLIPLTKYDKSSRQKSRSLLSLSVDIISIINNISIIIVISVHNCEQISALSQTLCKLSLRGDSPHILTVAMKLANC
jgi:hypothetical protein